MHYIVSVNPAADDPRFADEHQRNLRALITPTYKNAAVLKLTDSEFKQIMEQRQAARAMGREARRGYED